MKKKKLVLITLLILVLLPLSVTFGRYVVEKVKSFILSANNFFFNSDKLVENGITYNINNWGGTSNIEIQFQLNNHKNNILTSDSDIEYSISSSCSDGVICSLSSDGGIIQKEEMTDNITLLVTPTVAFENGESVNISVSATSSSPYVKTLSANFVVTVGTKGINYDISDKVGQPYFLFNITNTLDTYKVIEGFLDYSIGDLIPTSDYLELSSENKAKCASALITLTFDPTVVIIDNTSDILEKSTTTVVNIDGVNYINSITFKMDVLSSMDIRFYKLDSNQNYTYPFVNSTSIVTFSAL